MKQPRQPDGPRYRAFHSRVQSVDDTNRTIEFAASTETPDRYGDVIRVDGRQLDNFQKNPVFLWAHRSEDPPIGRIISANKDTAPLDNSDRLLDELPDSGFLPPAELPWPLGSKAATARYFRQRLHAFQEKFPASIGENRDITAPVRLRRIQWANKMCLKRRNECDVARQSSTTAGHFVESGPVGCGRDMESNRPCCFRATPRPH